MNCLVPLYDSVEDALVFVVTEECGDESDTIDAALLVLSENEKRPFSGGGGPLTAANLRKWADRLDRYEKERLVSCLGCKTTISLSVLRALGGVCPMCSSRCMSPETAVHSEQQEESLV